MDRIAGRKQIGTKRVMPFTIPSGIVTTEVSCLERIANEVPEIGILTTKSIGPEPRAGNREPILAEYAPGCFVNAVGLTNPGAEEFARKLSGIRIPDDKFLLASIFGKSPDEFVYVMRTLNQYADGFELNLSCPHAQEHGQVVGQDKDLSFAIVHAVSGMTKKPVFVKLSPNIPNIAEAAESAMRAGAYGITAVNTVGPKYWSVDGNPVLTNKVGGMSGRGILPFGLSAVQDITQKLGNIPLIVMGGIATARSVMEYSHAGASFFGIGSALAGMTESDLKDYFEVLKQDLRDGTNRVEELGLFPTINMVYRRVYVTERLDVGCDFKLIKTNHHLKASAGQFVFAWIPGVGEKPFSVMDNSPLILGILERGHFTKAINALQKGDSFYVRGPYGQSIPSLTGQRVALVGGGCGIAGLYLLAKRLHDNNEVDVFLAAKDKDHIPYLDEFRQFGEVFVATEDGSLGKNGLVTSLFGDYSANYFFNCGPKAMVKAVLPIELAVTLPQNVYSSVDYMTRCGVGICGSCADEKGRRTCVEGPFMSGK